MLNKNYLLHLTFMAGIFLPVFSYADTGKTNLKYFDFKGVQAGQIVSPDAVGDCKPQDGGQEYSVKCTGYDNNIAGISLLVAPDYYFYKSRLTNMVFIYPNAGGAYLTFLAAFSQKYGRPSSLVTEKWQNRLGNTLNNPTAIWSFKTGKLTLKALGMDIRYGSVDYEDNYQAPSQPADVNF